MVSPTIRAARAAWLIEDVRGLDSSRLDELGSLGFLDCMFNG